MIDNELSASIDAIRARGGSNEEIISRVREHDQNQNLYIPEIKKKERAKTIEDIVAAVKKCSYFDTQHDEPENAYDAAIRDVIAAIRRLENE